MSYDLAVWHGPRPADHFAATEEFQERMEAAGAEFEQRMAAGADDGDTAQAGPAILDFLAELTARYPDTEPDDADGPWASTPLSGDASSDYAYLCMTTAHLDEAVPFIASVAARRGLVCYDPQQGAVLDAGGRRDGTLAKAAGPLSHEARVREAWYSSKRGLGQALDALDLSLDQLRGESDVKRAVAAGLAWHLSTNGSAPVSRETAADLVKATEEHVRSTGWGGSLRICLGGDHFSVGELMVTRMPNCADIAASFSLSDLRSMGRAAA